MDTDLLDDESSKEGLSLSTQAINDLITTSKWTRFLAVLGFIGLGFMIIGAMAMFALPSPRYGYYGPDPALIAIIYIAMAGIYFFPVYYLLLFSNKMRDAVKMSNNMTLDQAFGYLKSHYKFVGIVAIVIVSIYILLFLGGLMTALIR